MAEIVGQALCPQCQEHNDAWHDGRKYYIKCSSCHTFTTYQRKAAKEKFLAEYLITEPPPDEYPPVAQPAQETETPDTPPIEKAKRGFFDSYADYY